MYRPQRFKVDDIDLLKELIINYPLGTLVSNHEGALMMNYLPFLLEEENGNLILTAHLARMNPHTKLLTDAPVLVSFQGPNRYISPSWYKTTTQVPTWNYTAVQVRGTASLIQDPQEVDLILDRSVIQFEKNNQTTWQYKTPEEQRNKLLQHIIGLKIQIESIDGKFKLNQNRESEDFKAVCENLKKSSLTPDHEMLEIMLRTTK